MRTPNPLSSRTSAADAFDAVGVRAAEAETPTPQASVPGLRCGLLALLTCCLWLPAAALGAPAGAVKAPQAGATQVAASQGSSAADSFSVKPDAGGVPGVAKLHTLVNALYAIVLVLVLAGFLASAGAWALGAHSNHYQAAHYGKRGLLISAAAAAALGVGPAFLSFLFGLFGGGAGG